MAHKTLALILAGGKGSRVKHLLNEDEPVKAMIKAGNKRLIDLVLDSLEGVDARTAMLSYPSEQYQSLDELAESREVKVLKELASHMKVPYLLELPLVLLAQYHLSQDSKYLKSFDSIITLPYDVVFNG